MELPEVTEVTAVTGGREKTEHMQVANGFGVGENLKMAAEVATVVTAEMATLPEMVVRGPILSTLVVALKSNGSCKLRTSTTKAVHPASLEREAIPELAAMEDLRGTEDLGPASGRPIGVLRGTMAVGETKARPVRVGPGGWSGLSFFLPTN